MFFRIRWLAVTAVFSLILITSTKSAPMQAVTFLPAAVGNEEVMLIGRGLATGVAFAPDGQTLAVATNIGVWLYPLAAMDNGRFLRHTAPVTHLAWSADSRQVSTITADNQLHLSYTTTGRHLQTEKGEAALFDQPEPTNRYQSPDGRFSAAICEDETTVTIMDTATGQVQQTLTGHTDTITNVGWSPDGQQLATTADDDTVRLWRVADGRLLAMIDEH